MHIRRAVEKDFDQIWIIFKEVVKKGNTYVFAPDTSMEIAYAYWFEKDIISFVAEDEDRIVGVYRLVANQPDLGSHVANASFMVHPNEQGKGIGRFMGEHCLKVAKRLGYKAMQFNYVVSTNHGAIKLWENLGFKIVGTLPKAFKHTKLGYVDVYVMYKILDNF